MPHIPLLPPQPSALATSWHPAYGGLGLQAGAAEGHNRTEDSTPGVRVQAGDKPCFPAIINLHY